MYVCVSSLSLSLSLSLSVCVCVCVCARVRAQYQQCFKVNYNIPSGTVGVMQSEDGPNELTVNIIENDGVCVCVCVIVTGL